MHRRDWEHVFNVMQRHYLDVAQHVNEKRLSEPMAAAFRDAFEEERRRVLGELRARIGTTIGDGYRLQAAHDRAADGGQHDG